MNLATLKPPLMDIANIIDPPLPRDETKVHVSTLRNKAAKIGGKKVYDDEPSEVGWAMMAMGKMWEVHAQVIVDHYARQMGMAFGDIGRITEKDGIVGTLDGLLWKGEKIGVVEAKLRFTAPSDPRDNWMWMVQVKAYCHMEGVTAVWMPVLYIPLRGQPKPEFQLHILTFTELELEENWRMLLSVRDMEDKKDES